MGKQPGTTNLQGVRAANKSKKGSRVRLTVEKNRIVMEPVEKAKITLESLLAKVTPENIHPETDWGKPMGKEIW